MASWKTEFPWVTYNNAHGMRCQYCMAAGNTNTFTKGCDKFKKDVLSKHGVTVDHRAAIEAKAAKRDMQQAISHSYRDQGLAVIAALRTDNFMAKKNLPNDHFSDLKLMQGSTDIGNFTV